MKRGERRIVEVPRDAEFECLYYNLRDFGYNKALFLERNKDEGRNYVL